MVSKKGNRGGTRERGGWPVFDPDRTRNPRHWPSHNFHFRPPHRASTVLIESSWDTGHTPTFLVAVKQLERRRFGSKELQHHPFLLPSIPPELGRTTTRILFLSSPSSVSDQPRHLKPSFWPWTIAGKLTALGVRSSAITACGGHRRHHWIHRGQNYQIWAFHRHWLSPVTVDRWG